MKINVDKIERLKKINGISIAIDHSKNTLSINGKQIKSDKELDIFLDKRNKAEQILKSLGAENKLEAVIDQINLMRKTLIALYKTQPKREQEKFKKNHKELVGEFEKVDKVINDILKN